MDARSGDVLPVAVPEAAEARSPAIAGTSSRDAASDIRRSTNRLRAFERRLRRSRARIACEASISNAFTQGSSGNSGPFEGLCRARFLVLVGRATATTRLDGCSPRESCEEIVCPGPPPHKRWPTRCSSPVAELDAPPRPRVPRARTAAAWGVPLLAGGTPYYFKRLKGARGNADPRTRTAATCNEPGGRRGRRLSRLAIRLSSHTPVLPRSLSAGKAKGSERAPHGRSPSGQQASSRHTSSVIPGGLRSRSRTTRARRIPRDRQLQRQQPRDRCRPPRARGTRVTANGPAVIGVHGERYTRPRKPIRPQSGTSG